MKGQEGLTLLLWARSMPVFATCVSALTVGWVVWRSLRLTCIPWRPACWRRPGCWLGSTRRGPSSCGAPPWWWTDARGQSSQPPVWQTEKVKIWKMFISKQEGIQTVLFTLRPKGLKRRARHFPNLWIREWEAGVLKKIKGWSKHLFSKGQVTFNRIVNKGLCIFFNRNRKKGASDCFFILTTQRDVPVTKTMTYEKRHQNLIRKECIYYCTKFCLRVSWEPGKKCKRRCLPSWQFIMVKPHIDGPRKF